MIDTKASMYLLGNMPQSHKHVSTSLSATALSMRHCVFCTASSAAFLALIAAPIARFAAAASAPESAGAELA